MAAWCAAAAGSRHWLQIDAADCFCTPAFVPRVQDLAPSTYTHARMLMHRGELPSTPDSRCAAPPPEQVHGDLKPENVLLSGDCVLKIADLGQSQFFERGDTFNRTRGTPAFLREWHRRRRMAGCLRLPLCVRRKGLRVIATALLVTIAIKRVLRGSCC